jgi:lipid-A-disaccharide synthase-like uncharacterized protein
MSKSDTLWLIIGFTGQLMFSLRFLVQWLKSEQAQRSIMPIHFWYFSIAGGTILLAYAIHKLDPVFILGQATGLFIYLRNLQFITREHHAPSVESRR